MEPRSRRQLWQFEKRAIGQEVASHGAPLLAQPRPEEYRGERTTEEAAHMSKVVDTGPWRETQGHVNETELHDGFELRVEALPTARHTAAARRQQHTRRAALDEQRGRTQPEAAEAACERVLATCECCA